MIVTIVEVTVKEKDADAFIAATLENHRHSLQEPGNLRFDILRVKNQMNRFFLYEAYESTQAAAAHKETAHYQRWRNTVAPFMAAERVGIPCEVIAPDRTGW